MGGIIVLQGEAGFGCKAVCKYDTNCFHEIYTLPLGNSRFHVNKAAIIDIHPIFIEPIMLNTLRSNVSDRKRTEGVRNIDKTIGATNIKMMKGVLSILFLVITRYTVAQ
jgi:hypothetical protein